ncbi:hypothetical protein [Streptomyces tailanensis]|uniref:hypothetical protein n=1 Tax=Streptomyces tailanensis TaxID=2569858 RepID=UPI001C0F1899|nr:hypothetical protein [Streptomyces tailanensis]
MVGSGSLVREPGSGWTVTGALDAGVPADAVPRLLGARLGNQEIAEHLLLSLRTVEKHLAGLRNRTGQSDLTALIAPARRYAADR